MFIVLLLSLSRSSALKCVSLNSDPCMVRPTLSLDKCSGSVDALSTKIYVPSETKKEMLNYLIW